MGKSAVTDTEVASLTHQTAIQTIQAAVIQAACGKPPGAGNNIMEMAIAGPRISPIFRALYFTRPQSVYCDYRFLGASSEAKSATAFSLRA